MTRLLQPPCRLTRLGLLLLLWQCGATSACLPQQLAAAGVLLGGGSELHRRQQCEWGEQHPQAGDRPRPSDGLRPGGDVRVSEGT